MEFGTIILIALGYPFVAAWIVGAGRNRRLAELENEIAALQRLIQGRDAAPMRDAPQRRPADEDWLPLQDRPDALTEWGTEAQGGESAVPIPARTPHLDQAPASAEQLAQMRDEAPGSVHDKKDDELAHTAPDPAGHPESLRDAATTADEQPPFVDAATQAPKTKKRLPGWASAALGWLLTGNLVAKLGLVILFIGVCFLLKYVAESVFIPIELRLAGVVLATLALLVWGWRLRTSRREIGLPVQGTAISILMLVVFAAYHRYELIPAAFAFAMLIALTALTCLFAVLQESPWLAAFGITGGFASPLLLSTAAGQHVTLFSYYALLNAGVFALAIKRAWRPLNLLGFAFTFIVGTAWGGLHYSSANYLTAQGFLGLFFLFYVAIALAFARQQQTRSSDYVDVTLVLGTPLLAFGLQTGLVKDIPFGMALSALALGGFYLILASVLWHRRRERSHVLVETFAALGVIFGTLAIPFHSQSTGAGRRPCGLLRAPGLCGSVCGADSA